MSGTNELIDEAQKVIGLLMEQTPHSLNLMKLDALLQMIRPKADRVEVFPIFGRKTRKPFVELRHRDFLVQWSPADARHHAMAVLEVAEAAEQDAFFVTFIVEQLKSSDQVAEAMLQDFRGYRAAQREKE